MWFAAKKEWNHVFDSDQMKWPICFPFSSDVPHHCKDRCDDTVDP